MLKQSMSVLFAMMIAAVPASFARAGFTVTTGTDLVTNTDTAPAGGSVGDSFSVGGLVNGVDGLPAGTFSTYTADGPSDPQILGSDLNFYRYNLSGTISSVIGNLATYSGTYLIFYDQNLNGEPDEGLRVSGGTLSATGLFDPLTGETAVFTGSLTQTQGPSNPAFADLSYGGSPVMLTGAYTDSTLGDGPSPTGTLVATLRQSATTVPEPASALLFAIGGVIAMGLRRRS